MVAAGVLVLIALIAIIPFVASTQIVRDRIALELSTWSGYQVTLGASPEIDIWPVFKANLANVTFSEWGGNPQPVIRADRIEADLSAFAALRGNIVFTHFKLVRPTFHVWQESYRRGSTPGWGGGRIGQAIAAARAAIETNPSAPSAASLPADPFGVLEFVDGRVFLHRDSLETEVLSSASGRLNWPAMNRSATATLNGIWRGEVVSLDFSSAQPLFLAAGGTAPLSVTLRSAPVTGSFEGSANLSGDTHFDGNARLSTPSMRRALEWSRADIASGAAVGTVAIESRVTGAMGKLKLANTTITLDGNRGTGTLEISPWKAVPAISGTLAFDKIDLRSFLSAFSALTPDALGNYRTIDRDVADQVSFDLRLSATNAAVGSVVLSNLAATAQVKPGLAAFDISDATAFGGTVQASMRVDRQTSQAEVEFKLRGEDIDMGALAQNMKARNLVPVARGTFSLTLKGTGEDIADVIRSASGSASASFGPGAMAGIDLAKFAQRASLGEFFPLSDVGGGSLAFTGIALKAGIEYGTARVERLEVTTAEGSLSLRGIVPLPGRGLALAGRVERTGAGQADIPFFVGGSWEAPYISPVLPGMEAP